MNITANEDIKEAMRTFKTFSIVSCHGYQIPVSRRIAKEYLAMCLANNKHPLVVQALILGLSEGIIHNGG